MSGAILEAIFTFLFGVAAGVVATWAYHRQQRHLAFASGQASIESERDVLVERAAALHRDAERLRGALAEAHARWEAAVEGARAEAERRSAAEASASRVPQLEAALREAASAAKESDQVNADLGARLSALTERLEAERSAAGQKLALLDEAQSRLANAFRALSGEALQANNRMFLDLAAQTLGSFREGAQGDLERRQQAIAELVAPVKSSLDKLDSRIVDIERAREGAYRGLTEQVRSLAEGHGALRRETSNLVNALRQPAARGRWGELQLRRVVEMAGMLAHCDFVEQATVGGDEGRMRPDLVIRLPGGRNIVVDAKTPLTAYLEAAEIDDDERRRQRLADHARQVRDHMTRLGRKSYQDQFDTTPELVVLFLPGEMFFSAALEQDPALIEFGVGEKVIPATPTTLIAMLRAIAYGWKQEALARNARDISELGRQLHERIATLAGHWSKLGKNLGDAVGAYNSAVASLESRVLVSARRFKDLKAIPDGRDIDVLEQVQAVPRALEMPDVETEAA